MAIPVRVVLVLDCIRVTISRVLEKACIVVDCMRVLEKARMVVVGNKFLFALGYR